MWYGPTSLLGCLLLVSACLGEEWDPPKPNPADPVDYIAWVNETLGGRIEDNAFEDYKAAFALIQPFEGDWGNTLAGPWSDNPEVSAWLEANREGLTLFRKAAAKRECFFALEKHGEAEDQRWAHCMSQVLLPSLRPHRSAAKGLIAEGWQAWQEDDHDRLIDNAIAVLRSARHLAGGPTLVGRLVAAACARLTYDALCQALLLSEDRDRLAVELLSRLEETDTPWPPFGQSCRSERLASWDLCQRLFERPRRDGTWKLHASARQIGATIVDTDAGPILNRRDLWKLGKIGLDRTLQEVNAYFDAVDQWNATGYPEAAGQADHFAAFCAGSENPLLREFLPSLTKARCFDERRLALRRGTHLIVRIFAYRAERGRLPDSLDDIGGPGLALLRVDPFSGKDLVYQRQDASFRLYSVAENLRDDGERHDAKWANGDYVLWPPEASN